MVGRRDHTSSRRRLRRARRASGPGPGTARGRRRRWRRGRCASPVFRTWLGLGVLFWPGRGDLEEFEDLALGGGESVEADAGVGVGEAEALEGGEEVAAGGGGGAAFGEQAGELVAVESCAGL